MTCAHRIAAVLLLVLALPVAAPAWERGQVTTFATLPPGAAHPEGITVDGKGNVYVTTFAVTGTPSGVGQMFVYDSRGRLLRSGRDMPGSMDRTAYRRRLQSVSRLSLRQMCLRGSIGSRQSFEPVSGCGFPGIPVSPLDVGSVRIESESYTNTHKECGCPEALRIGPP